MDGGDRQGDRLQRGVSVSFCSLVGTREPRLELVRDVGSGEDFR